MRLAISATAATYDYFAKAWMMPAEVAFALRVVCLSFAALTLPAYPQTIAEPTPVVLYTDIASGPNYGGEGDNGIYLSIFGKGFGIPIQSAFPKVFIGEVEVSRYIYFGKSKGRSDVQQISVQIGKIGTPRPNVPLPVTVVANGRKSNQNITFAVNPGRILYVDNIKGNDLTAIVGDASRPFRHVQVSDLRQAAWGEASPGDFIVLRGTGKAWTDNGHGNYFLKARDKSGTNPTGSDKSPSGPISIMGYPGEDVLIQALPGEKSEGGAFSGVDGTKYAGLGEWITLANLRIESGRDSGAINVQNKGNNWRIVNNEITAKSARSSAKAGGITGNGSNSFWVGNQIHDVACGPPDSTCMLNHGIYVDGDGSFEIGYNHISAISGGSGIQVYLNGSAGSYETSNIRIHHNRIERVAKYGVNLADGSARGIIIWNNIVQGSGQAELRLNSSRLAGCIIVNNTFVGLQNLGPRKPVMAAISNDAILARGALMFSNNIVAVGDSRQRYVGGTVGFSDALRQFSNNIWFNGTGPIPAGNGNYETNPRFVHHATGDFGLEAGSPAIGKGLILDLPALVDDYNSIPRKNGSGRPVIGAIGYYPKPTGNNTLGSFFKNP